MNLLVDLANTHLFRGLRRPTPDLVAARLDPFIATIASALSELDLHTPVDIHVRLYDGWFDDDGRPADLHHLMRKHLPAAYPTRRRRYRLFVEIADSTRAARPDKLMGTVRTQTGLSRYSVAIHKASPAHCARHTSCAIEGLRSWLRGFCPVESCPVHASEITTYREQKMVDAAIVADAVWLASREEPIAIVSNDEDVIPALITARSFGVLVVWFIRDAQPRSVYASLIAKHGIRCLEC
jgi:uncharacterized LabA/DUF88 family protein